MSVVSTQSLTKRAISLDSPSIWREQVDAGRGVVIVSVTITSIADNLTAVVDANCRHQQDLRGYQVVQITNPATARPNDGMRTWVTNGRSPDEVSRVIMRDSVTTGRDPDDLSRVIDAEGHTEIAAGERAQVVHALPFGPDERMHARRATRCTDDLPRVIDGVRFTPVITGKNAQ